VFIHLASLAARQRLIYRISGFILFAATLMEISALVFFWRVAQGESMDEAILGPQGITGYIILAGLLGAANIGFGDQQMGKAVRSGEVVRHFLQPLDIQMTMLAREIGGWMGAALLTTIPVLLLSSIIIGTPRPAGAIPLLAFIISWLLGAATIAAFDYCVGLLTFRTVLRRLNPSRLPTRHLETNCRISSFPASRIYSSCDLPGYYSFGCDSESSIDPNRLVCLSDITRETWLALDCPGRRSPCNLK
jgi:hypothetical protein